MGQVGSRLGEPAGRRRVEDREVYQTILGLSAPWGVARVALKGSRAGGAGVGGGDGGDGVHLPGVSERCADL